MGLLCVYMLFVLGQLIVVGLSGCLFFYGVFKVLYFLFKGPLMS